MASPANPYGSPSEPPAISGIAVAVAFGRRDQPPHEIAIGEDVVGGEAHADVAVVEVRGRRDEARQHVVQRAAHMADPVPAERVRQPVVAGIVGGRDHVSMPSRAARRAASTTSGRPQTGSSTLPGRRVELVRACRTTRWRVGYHAVQPPSTGRLAPVTKRDAELARKTAAPPRSSGLPRRPSGTFWVSAAAKAGRAAAPRPAERRRG